MARTGSPSPLRIGDPAHPPFDSERVRTPGACARLCALLPLLVLALLLSACGRERAAWPPAGGAVRFSAGEVRVLLAPGHALAALELRDDAGDLLLRQPVPPGQPLAVRFGYEWAPGEGLWLGAVPAPADAAPLPPVPLRAPPVAPAPVAAALQLPAGLDVPADDAPLLLPAGASGTLALRLTRRVAGTGTVRATLHVPPWLALANPDGTPALAREGTIVRTVRLAGRDDTALLRFRLSLPAGAAGARGTLAWEVRTADGAPLVAARRGVQALAPAALGAGLAIAENVFPADARERPCRTARASGYCGLHRGWRALPAHWAGRFPAIRCSRAGTSAWPSPTRCRAKCA